MLQDVCQPFQSTIYRLPINCLVIYFDYLFNWIDSYELYEQGGGEKKFSDRPLDGEAIEYLILSIILQCTSFFVP